MKNSRNIKASVKNDYVNTLQTNIENTSPLFTTEYIQGILKEALGYYIRAEFLIGTQEMVSREGYLSNVGINFFVLYDEPQNVYILCDIYSVKFVYFTAYKNFDYILNFSREEKIDPEGRSLFGNNLQKNNGVNNTYTQNQNMQSNNNMNDMYNMNNRSNMNMQSNNC